MIFRRKQNTLDLILSLCGLQFWKTRIVEIIASVSKHDVPYVLLFL